MARPKTGKPPKKSLNLTVSTEVREALNYISLYYGESVSALVSSWAVAEARKLRAGADKEPDEAEE